MSATAAPQQDDLAALRAIAEEGRRRPLLGARPLIAYGLAIAAAALLHAAIVRGALPLPIWSLTFIWFGMMIFAGLVGRVRSKGSPLARANRVERDVWQAAGAVLALAAIALVAFALSYQDRIGAVAWSGLAAMPPLTFAIYAVALNASASAGDAMPLLRLYVGLSIGFMVATILTAMTGWQMIVFAVGALACSVLPGIVLRRAERAA